MPTSEKTLNKRTSIELLQRLHAVLSILAIALRATTVLLLGQRNSASSGMRCLSCVDKNGEELRSSLALFSDAQLRFGRNMLLGSRNHASDVARSEKFYNSVSARGVESRDVLQQRLCAYSTHMCTRPSLKAGTSDEARMLFKESVRTQRIISTRRCAFNLNANAFAMRNGARCTRRGQMAVNRRRACTWQGKF